MSLGPRPMYSCWKRDIPSQTAASISPCVFINDLEGRRCECWGCRRGELVPRGNTASFVRNSVEILPEISAIVEGELVKHSQLRVRALAFQRARSMMQGLRRWTA